MGLFNETDICGVFGDGLTTDEAAAVGAALANWMRALGRPRLAASSDTRPGGSELRLALLEGLTASGGRGVDLGVLPAAMLEFAGRTLEVDAVVQVTAGHLPARYNGFRILRNGWPLMPDDLAAVEALTHEEATLASGGGLERTAVHQDYQAWLLSRFAGKVAPLRMVVDPGGGAWAGWAGRLLGRLGLEVVTVGDRPDLESVPRPIDPSDPAASRSLTETVTANAADLGVAFDSDGGRFRIADGRGRVWSDDAVSALLVRECLDTARTEAARADVPHRPRRRAERPWMSRRPAPPAAPVAPGEMLVGNGRANGAAEAVPATVVFDLDGGFAVIDAVRAAGAVPRIEATGNNFLRYRTLREDAPVGVGAGGRAYWGELSGGCDALFSLLTLLSAAARRGAGPADLPDAVPDFPSAPTRRVAVPPEVIEAACSHLAATFASEAEVIRLGGGVRLQFESAWASVRPAAAGGAALVCFQGRTRDDLDDVVELVGAQLPAPLQ
jgi:phosphomannomutase